ncbi:HNH endonuclease [Corynebacterium casei]|uniref:HNH endonuclease n=1 Tax=Corynebacterium casei TaxID=160386 RepID=UPI003FD6B6A6
MTNAYSSYLAAKASGWDVLLAFHRQAGSLQSSRIARRDGITEREVNELKRMYKRIQPRGKVAAKLGLSLDMLILVSKSIGKVDARLNDVPAVLTRMLKACEGSTLHQADARLRKLLEQVERGASTRRTSRLNFAKQPDEHGMLNLMGKFKSDQARAIMAAADPFIKTAMKKNPALQYDQLLANWVIKRLMDESSDSVDETNITYTPMIILSGDPNVDIARGHLNTLSGAQIPLEEAVNLKLAGTGYVALTTIKDGKAHLETIAPIINERFSKGLHRVGVIMENLVCAHEACNLPAMLCAVHHIRSVGYHNGETSWENTVSLCGPHNAQNDDNPNAPPRNGRIERDEDGWAGLQEEPEGPIHHNPNPQFREGWRGTAHDMADNFTAYN